MIYLVTMAMNVDSKLLSIVFIFLSDLPILWLFHPILRRSMPGPYLKLLVVTGNCCKVFYISIISGLLQKVQIAKWVAKVLPL